MTTQQRDELLARLDEYLPSDGPNAKDNSFFRWLGKRMLERSMTEATDASAIVKRVP